MVRYLMKTTEKLQQKLNSMTGNKVQKNRKKKK